MLCFKLLSLGLLAGGKGAFLVLQGVPNLDDAGSMSASCMDREPAFGAYTPRRNGYVEVWVLILCISWGKGSEMVIPGL